MSSTLCVKCGSDLVPFSYCKVCNQVIRFVCSSCNMISDERFHLYCKEVSKKDVEILHSNKKRERGQILIDTYDFGTFQTDKAGHEKHEEYEEYEKAASLSPNRWNDYIILAPFSFVKSVFDNQDQLSEQLRYSSVNLSSSYLSTFFECLKLVNNYWMKIYTYSTNKLLKNGLSSR
jgi:hypothetical protein